MFWGRAVVLAFIAVFGLTACTFSLSGDKPAKEVTHPDYLPPRDEANWAKMQAFLDAYKHKEGVKTLDNGIAYRVLASGDRGGRHPTWASTVVTRYKGMLSDGTVFDESTKDPAQFELGSLVKGWQEAVTLMRPGDKWEIVMPSDLGYGRGGKPPKIAPDQVLVFEIELIDIK